MLNKEVHVIVLGRNYADEISAIRALGVAGCTVDLIASVQNKDGASVSAASKYVHKTVEIVHKMGKEDQDEAAAELVEELLKHKNLNGPKPVIFPTDDYTVSVVDHHRSELEPYFLLPSIVGGGDGSMVHLMNKTVQAQMAQTAGLSVPREWTFDLSEEIVVPADMVFPCICKRMDSETGYESEMAVCEDEAEFLEHMNRLRRRSADRMTLVQEFLHVDHEINVSGVCLDQEVIVPGIIRKTHVAKNRVGVVLAGEMISFDRYGDLREKVISLLRQFRYVGMFDVELNVVGDKVYFNEVDLRSDVHSDAYLKSGVNLPALFVKGVLGEEHSLDEETIREYGKSFVNEKAAWEDYFNDHITKEELDRIVNQADYQLLFDEDDPAVHKQFWKRIHHIENRRHMKKLKRRFKRAAISFVLGALQVVFRYPQTKRENQRNPEAEKPRIIVSGRNYASNLCLARAFGKAGYEVEVLRIYQRLPRYKRFLGMLHPDAYSKYIKAHHVCVTRGRSLTLVNKLRELADPNRKMLLIPADDLVASIVDEYYNELAELYVIPNVDGCQGAIGHLMNKETQTELAIAAGLPVLNSCVIRSSNRQFEIPETVKYPCFIKPNISKNGSKTKMQRCNDRDELYNALADLAKQRDFEMKVEDFVDIRREYSILGLSTKDVVIGPGLFGADFGGHGGQRGIAMSGEVLPRSQQGELIDHVCRFIKSLNYEGLFDVDLIETMDGEVYFVELNLRYGGSGYSIVESGVNLPGMFADYMLMNKPVDVDCCVQPGKTFVNERVMLGEYKEGYLTAADMKEWMKKVDIHFIYDEEDPMAYKCYKKLVFLTKLKKLKPHK